MLTIDRQDRIFNNALSIVSSRQTDEGFACAQCVKRLNRKIRARRAASDEAFEAYQSSGYEGSFLDYILEHWDQIFAIIQKIMSLFGV